MRKAKVVAIVCGMIASCLFGGFAVVEAATITLDDSSTTEPAESVVVTADENPTAAAATETSIKTTAPAEASTTTKSVKTKETTAAPLETTTPASTAASIMTDAAQTAAPKTTAIEVKAVRSTAPATEATKATTKATATTTTTTVVVTAPVVIQTVAATEAVEDITNPPMPDQQIDIEPEVNTVIENPIEFEIPDAEPVVVTPPSSVSESDYILLCNAVAHEAGANSVPVTEKAKVVEVIMNRVASPNYPNDVYGVLTQKRQFSGSSTYVDLGTFSYKVTDMVKEAVDLYFADPSQFSEGYLSFTGDGKQNYFR